VTEREILTLFDEWNAALQTRDSLQVAALYERNAILLPTASNQVRHNTSEIIDYFEQFLRKDPKAKIGEVNVRILGEIAINSGVYTFLFGDRTELPVRFTFVYRWNGTKWMIIEHHSSCMPE